MALYGLRVKPKGYREQDEQVCRASLGHHLYRAGTRPCKAVVSFLVSIVSLKCSPPSSTPHPRHTNTTSPQQFSPTKLTSRLHSTHVQLCFDTPLDRITPHYAALVWNAC